MAAAVALHDRILSDVVTGHGGTVIKLTGDGVFARFVAADDAITAAITIQRSIARLRDLTGTGE